MVTKYDLFELIYKHKKALKPKEVVAKLDKGTSEYNNIRMLLVSLENDQLLTKTKFGFEVKKSSNTERLYYIIRYCLHNNINYNLLLDKNLVTFIGKSLRKGEMNSRNCEVSPKTFRKYIEILRKYGLLLILSKKPLRVRLFYNSLIKNLLLYFRFKPMLTAEKVEFVDEISEEFKKFQQLRKKNEVGYKRIVDNLEISFVHHSLALEGNPITLPDTFNIIKKNIIPKNLSTEDVDEVRNYQQAILQMLKESSQRGVLTLSKILEYHYLAMKHHPEIAGKIREINVFIRGNPAFKVSPVEEIKERLNKLLEKYHQFIRREKKSWREIIRFSTLFHNEFQHIHPFEDGNSRTTRLLTFYILQSEGIPILDMPLGLLDEYMNNTKKATRRSDKNLFEHFQKLILFNLKNINEKLKL